MLVSFVIPCYRSELTIEGVVQEIQEVMRLRPEYEYEIVCVNDCSPDGVYEKLKKLAAADTRIKVLNFAKNCGKHSALLAGYKVVVGDVVVTLDDDGQCPVERTWDLVDALDENVDMAIALYANKKESGLKKFGSRVNSCISSILVPQPKGIHFENFSAAKQFVYKEAVKYTNPYPMMVPLILQATQKIVNIPMEDRERADGKSTGFTFRKSFALMINGFTNFSVVPLRIASLLGCVVAFLGFLYAVWAIVKKLLNPEIIVGYYSTMAAILVIGGILMLLLGIIGEYLGRLYICVNNSPQYVVRDMINVQQPVYQNTRTMNTEEPS